MSISSNASGHEIASRPGPGPGTGTGLGLSSGPGTQVPGLGLSSGPGTGLGSGQGKLNVGLMAGQSTFFGRNDFEPEEDVGIMVGGKSYSLHNSNNNLANYVNKSTSSKRNYPPLSAPTRPIASGGGLSSYDFQGNARMNLFPVLFIRPFLTHSLLSQR